MQVKYGTIEWIIPMTETYQKKETYTGDIKGWTADGIGKFVFLDGSVYEGEVKGNFPNGKGKMTLQNNEVLSGQFINGEYQKPKIYKQVKLGNQIWMAENLSVTQFRNGELIPEAHSQEEWKKYNSMKQPAWCYYKFDPKYNELYGKLYNGYAVMDHRGLAPTGWHISTEDDWIKLESHLQNKYHYDYKKHIKNKTLWPMEIDNFGFKTELNGTNDSGYSAVPGGEISSKGEFYGGPDTRSYNASHATVRWWTCTFKHSSSFDEVDPDLISFSLVSNYFDGLEDFYTYPSNGAYVRCVKD